MQAKQKPAGLELQAASYTDTTAKVPTQSLIRSLPRSLHRCIGPPARLAVSGAVTLEPAARKWNETLRGFVTKKAYAFR